MGQFESLKQIFCKFVGQSDLKGQGHKFLEWSKTFIQRSSLKLKFLLINSCCIHKKSTKFLSFKANLTLKVKVRITSFQNCIRHLDDE